jgi:hypothetical protein
VAPRLAKARAVDAEPARRAGHDRHPAGQVQAGDDVVHGRLEAEAGRLLLLHEGLLGARRPGR